jgi:hypothetical protein
MFHYFEDVLKAIWKEIQTHFEENLSLQDPKIRMRNQLRSLYGRGGIRKEVFLDQRMKLERGQIGLGEIANLQQEAQVRTRTWGEVAGERDPEIKHSLDRLYQDRGLLEEARSEILHRLQSLASEAGWVQEQVESARRNAQASLPDDAAARAYLEIWHRLQELSRGLEERQRVLEGALRNLDILEAGLRSSISDLRLLETEAGLARLRLGIHQDLLTQGHK